MQPCHASLTVESIRLTDQPSPRCGRETVRAAEAAAAAARAECKQLKSCTGRASEDAQQLQARLFLLPSCHCN